LGQKPVEQVDLLVVEWAVGALQRHDRSPRSFGHYDNNLNDNNIGIFVVNS
jgi:hypothetical protein